jgi:polar amino acid transport system substrate-binding protein
MRLAPAAVFAMFCLSGLHAAGAGALDAIKKRGTILIGVKDDYKPWGFRDAKGNLAGMEIDLARDIAQRLKVRLELVPVVAATRIPLLQDRKVDLILATFSVTAERKKQVAFVEPGYYAAMVGLLHKTGSGIDGEATLKGRTVCAVKGAYYNTAVAGMAGQPLVEVRDLSNAQDLLRAGSCDAVVYDDVVLLYELKSEPERWADYDLALLLTVTPAAWGLAIPLEEKDNRFSQFLSDTVKSWHRCGTLLALEKRWLGDNSMALQWLSQKVRLAEDQAFKVTPQSISAPERISPGKLRVDSNTAAPCTQLMGSKHG